jgi:peptidyl-prolyl cis-trans isomerase C
MNKSIVIFGLLALLLVGLPARADERNAAIPTDEEILALQDASAIITVNGRDVPRWMYDNALRDAQNHGSAGAESVNGEAGLRHVILHNLVDMEVLYQEAERRGMRVNLAGGVLRSRIIGNRYETMDDFRRTLAEAGMTESQYAELWRQQASVNQFLNEAVLAEIEVSARELQARYEQDKGKYARRPKIRASHILIPLAEEATDEQRGEARARLEGLRERIFAGADFADLARETGGFPSAVRGGDLGWFSRNKMVPAFSDAAFALPVGGVSEVVETSFGFHLIMKTAEQDPIPSLEEIGGQLDAVIRQEKGRDAFLALKEDLLRKAEVAFHDAELEEAYGSR